MKKVNNIMSLLLVCVIIIGTFLHFSVYANTTGDAITSSFQEDTRIEIIVNDFETKAMGHILGAATLTKTASPSGSGNVMKFTATAGNGNPRCQLTENVQWGGDLYSKYGMKNDRTIIAKIDMYLPQSAFDEMTSVMKYELNLGSANNDGLYGIGSVKITKPNSQDTTFTATCGNVTKQLTPNTWYNIKCIYQPDTEAAKVYLNNELFSSRSVPPENKITPASVANGFRFLAIKGTSITEGVYFDNVEIYQMENLIGVKNAKYNETNGELTLNFATNITQNELNKIVLKHNNQVVTNLITSKKILTDTHIAVLNLNASSVTVGGEYTVELPKGFTDANEQFTRAIYEKTFTAQSKDVYISSINTITEPSQNGAGASVTIQNDNNTEKSAWAAMAVFAPNNELIAIDGKNITVNGSSTVNFSLTNDCTGAVNVKIFLWNGENLMIPYEKSMKIWGN